MKLNLGCRHHKIKGFVNIDIDKSVNPDIVMDITKFNRFKDNSIDEIYASHVLEHINSEVRFDTLKKWYESLKLDGVLWIIIPDCEILKTAPSEIFVSDGYRWAGKTIEERRENIIKHADGLHAIKVEEMMLDVGFSFVLSNLSFSKCPYMVSKWKGQSLTKGIK